jgi:putative sigma-54 modulation protein
MQTVNVHPPVQVTGRHVSVTESMKEYAIGKIEHLHLDYPKIIDAQVILDVNKHRHHAEVILFCANHITIEASDETDDMYASIDGVLAKISRQMSKYKTRILRTHRPRNHEIRHVDEHVISLDALEENQENHEKDLEVIQTEKYPVKPMFVDEAVLQMEMSSRQFVVFLNAKTERVNVLYRRKCGNFGLIEPEFS